jgi:site-specific recombinase XerD
MSPADSGGRDVERYSPADSRLSEETLERLKRSVPANTYAAYKRELERYRPWCAEQRRVDVPATSETFAEYANHLAEAGLAPRSVERAIAIIRGVHKKSGYNVPPMHLCDAVLVAYRREWAEGEHGDGKAPPLLIADLRRMVRGLDRATPQGVRDRALIVLGWALMARRSEIANLNLSDVREVEQGIEVKIRWSKTDQKAEGRDAAVPYGQHIDTCPVRTVRIWRECLDRIGVTEGPLFRAIDRHGHLAGSSVFAGRSKSPRMTPQAVEVVMRRAALRAGMSEDFTPHSLRSGSATSARKAGHDALTIARHGGWQDGSKVLLGYLRTIDKWDENPMSGVGL